MSNPPEYRLNGEIKTMKPFLLTLFVLLLPFSLFGAEPWLVESTRLPEGSTAPNRLRMIWADSVKFRNIAEVVGGPIEVERWVNAPPKDHAGKFVLIEVWATWCPPCRRSLPLLEYYQEKYKDDLVVVSICETDENALKTMAAEPLKWEDLKVPLAVDTHRRFANKLGVFGIPHVVVIEPIYGAVLWEGMPTQIGYELSDDKMAKFIEARKKLAAAGKLPEKAPFEFVACPPDPNKPNEKPKTPVRCAGEDDGTVCEK